MLSFEVAWAGHAWCMHDPYKNLFPVQKQYFHGICSRNFCHRRFCLNKTPSLFGART